MVIRDQEGEPWAVESAVAAFQCESAALSKGNTCYQASIRPQPLQPLPMVNLEETLRTQDYRPQLAKGYKKFKPAAWLFPPPPRQTSYVFHRIKPSLTARCPVTCNQKIIHWKRHYSKDCLQPGQKDPYWMTLIYIKIKMMCREKPMPPKRLQPLFQTDPAGITTKVTPEPLHRTGRELRDPT